MGRNHGNEMQKDASDSLRKLFPKIVRSGDSKLGQDFSEQYQGISGHCQSVKADQRYTVEKQSNLNPAVIFGFG